MERKRPRPSSASETVVQQLPEPTAKHPKLILKPPDFLTTRQRQHEASREISHYVEAMLSLETAEEVSEHFLRLIEICKEGENEVNWTAVTSEEISKCLSALGKLAKCHRDVVSLCCVLMHAVEVFVAHWISSLGGSLPKNVQTFVLSLLDHDHADVKVSVLKCLSNMVDTSPDHKVTSFEEQVQEAVHRMVRSVHHGVRLECLKLIGQLSHVTDSCEPSLALLEEHVEDPDPRVRSSAFQALFQIYLRDPKALPVSVYHKASQALPDDSSGVRSKALRLIWALALHHPDEVIPLKRDKSVELSLLDDAFVKICDHVNDSSMPVRALAAQLLGDFSNVSEKFLVQTLDKKLMSHLKVVKSEHQRQLELHQGGGASSVDWDSGRNWGTGAPKLELDPGGISLMNAGACGAFVHGLEDEFMEVRSAAVESMCSLSLQSRVFAKQCLDYLVDMFNDEIEAIRLKAINSLCKISSTLELREDQLETVLAILEESSSVIRMALHNLLSSCRLTTSAGLNTTIHALLENLKKYPHDCPSIWKCLQQLGSNHSHLVSLLVPELLSTHPFFMGKEPDEDDPAYICILILVFNAAARCPVIPPLFPSHVFRHYTYLRDTLPHLIPHIKAGIPSSLKLSQNKRSSQVQPGSQFLSQVLSRAQLSSRLKSRSGSSSTLLSCVSDLLKMASLDANMAGSARAAAIFLQCQLLMNKVHDLLSQDVLLTSATCSHHSLPTITSSIRELLLLSYRLEHTFVGLSPSLVLQCRLVRASAHAMSLLLASYLDFDTEHSSLFSKMKQSFQERLFSLKKYCTDQSMETPLLVAPLLEIHLATVANETLNEALQPLSAMPLCMELRTGDFVGVREWRAELLEPKSDNREDFSKFVSSLALSVHVNASLSHVTDPASIAIQVRFPDGRQLMFPAKQSEIRTSGASEAVLDTAVILSHGVWTDPSRVELCVVRRFQTDMSEEFCLPFHTSSSSLASLKGSKSSTSKSGGKDATPTSLQAAPAFPAVANLVSSEREDELDKTSGVVVISEVANIGIHPLERLNNTFNTF